VWRLRSYPHFQEVHLSQTADEARGFTVTNPHEKPSMVTPLAPIPGDTHDAGKRSRKPREAKAPSTPVQNPAEAPGAGDGGQQDPSAPPPGAAGEDATNETQSN
jgi:hypothetical protein